MHDGANLNYFMCKVCVINDNETWYVSQVEINVQEGVSVVEVLLASLIISGFIHSFFMEQH